MYNVGQLVVYGGHGVCRVDGMEERTVDRKQVTYYVLKPLDHGQTEFYVPVHNPVALAKLRCLLTKQELVSLLRSEKTSENCWIPEENRRKQRYKELINSSDFASLVQMVNTLQIHRQQQLEAGKKFHLCDENFLRDAKRTLEGEISVVLEIPVAQIPEALQKLLDQQTTGST